jgi:XTP/dITP diphosphohydrolase
MESWMIEILLATGNPGKAREMQQILNVQDVLDRHVQWRLLSEFPDLPEAVEDGATFLENARKKAQHYAGLTGLLVIADDSGLEVDALAGAPGVKSARFAGEPKDDDANNALLIERLEGIPGEKRTARFRCAVVLANANEVLASAEGTFEGAIVDDPRGTNGFGYDPHFFVPDEERTAAELPPERKNELSHRGQALSRLREKIISLEPWSADE